MAQNEAGDFWVPEVCVIGHCADRVMRDPVGGLDHLAKKIIPSVATSS